METDVQRARHHGVHFTGNDRIAQLIDNVLDGRDATGFRFLDPACGDGNFLRHLRQRGVPENQLFGIELQPKFAGVAQESLRGSHIVCGNALRVEWPEGIDFIVGNPPFKGSLTFSTDQIADSKLIGGVGGHVDYAGLFVAKAWRYVKRSPQTEVGMITTSSIHQGIQPHELWRVLIAQGLHITFGVHPFQWEDTGANVMCTMVGFAVRPRSKRINAYLSDGDPSIILRPRREHISGAKKMIYGSLPHDGKFLLLSQEEKDEMIRECPLSAKWIKRLFGAHDFINGQERYCLWLVGVTDLELQAMPPVLARVRAVFKWRSSRNSRLLNLLKTRPHEFSRTRHVVTRKLLMPKVVSENRDFLTVGPCDEDAVVGDMCCCTEEWDWFDLGVQSSSMHRAFAEAFSGRMNSSMRYSVSLAYNNFVFPDRSDDDIANAARSILSERKKSTGATLAQLYGKDMPSGLRLAHERLDDAVDKAYGIADHPTDMQRVEFMIHMMENVLAENRLQMSLDFGP